MATQSEGELRRLIAEGLQALDAQRGGRHMSVVARTIGVDRTTVTRWLNGKTTASVDHCRSLASIYPEFFAEERLLELHSRAAMGDDRFGRAPTVGANVHESIAEVHRAAARSLLADPGHPSNRVCLLTSLHLDKRGVDSVDSDPYLDSESSKQVTEFRDAMSQRAAEGWKIRNVVVTTNVARIDGLEQMAKHLDGPDVEIRAYAQSVPLVLSPLIIGNRDVFLAYDHRRFERPHAALKVGSSPIVQWATTYFEHLFLDAPFTLRDMHGAVPSQFAALRKQLALTTQPPAEDGERLRTEMETFSER